MNYFKFIIPNNADGTRVSYSPNWAGTMPRCPKNVKVLLYNDKDGYGIAQTEDTFIPKEVTVLKSADALKVVTTAVDTDGVFFGDKLVRRWDVEVLNGE